MGQGQGQALATRPAANAPSVYAEQVAELRALSSDATWQTDVARAAGLCRTGLVPDWMRNKPAEVLAAFFVCDAMDIPRNPVTFGQLYSVHGKPGFMAALQLALAHRAGHKTKWLSDNTSETEAALEMDGQVFKFTAAQAAKAGLISQETYKKYLPDMLQWRAVTRAINKVCPEVLLGLRTAAPALFEGEPADDEVSGNGELVSVATELLPAAQAKTVLLNSLRSLGLNEETATTEAARIWNGHEGPVHPDYLEACLEEAEKLGAPFDGGPTGPLQEEQLFPTEGSE